MIGRYVNVAARHHYSPAQIAKCGQRDLQVDVLSLQRPKSSSVVLVSDLCSLLSGGKRIAVFQSSPEQYVTHLPAAGPRRNHESDSSTFFVFFDGLEGLQQVTKIKANQGSANTPNRLTHRWMPCVESIKHWRVYPYDTRSSVLLSPVRSRSSADSHPLRDADPQWPVKK